jgi:ketosteroid isomerase-like protein
MSQENVALTKRAYEVLNDAYRTGDYTGRQPFETFCHPEVTLRTSGMFPESGEYHGFDGLRRFTQNQAEAFEQMSVEPIEFIDAGEHVVVPIRFGGTTRHTGISASFSVTHVWTVRDGKAARIEFFADRAEALGAVGVSE